MFRQHEPATRSAAASPVLRERGAPDVPSELALALQRTAGNAATGRVLSRYTEGRKSEYEQAARQPAAVRELIAAVHAAHRGTFEFKGAREPLVQPLEQWVAAFEATVKQWEQTTDAEAEAKLVATAKGQIKVAAELRTALFTVLGGGDAAKGKEGVERVLTARKNARADEEARKQREAEAAAKKEADDKRRGELAAVFPMAAGGPAYMRPPDLQLARFAEHVALSHPAFAELSLDQLKRPTCPLYLLTGAQLASVQHFAGSMRLSEWTEQNTPTSRRESLGFERWIVPTKADTLTFELGGEIFSDWVVPKPNHGFRIGKLMEIWSFILQRRDTAYVRVTERDGKKIYEYQLKGRTETKIVTRHNDRVLITCFDTGRR